VYTTSSRSIESYLNESHSYKSVDNNFSIVFNEVYFETRVDVPTFSGYKTNKKKEYLHSNIVLKTNNIIVTKFKWSKGQRPQIIDQNELTLF